MNMLKLYRGLVDILICKSEILTSSFTKHIRGVDPIEPNENYGSIGFWNLLLEVTYLLYVKLFVSVGILMTTILAICFFPLYAMTRGLNSSLQMIREDAATPAYIEPKVDINQEKK